VEGKRREGRKDMGGKGRGREGGQRRGKGGEEREGKRGKGREGKEGRAGKGRSQPPHQQILDPPLLMWYVFGSTTSLPTCRHSRDFPSRYNLAYLSAVSSMGTIMHIHATL
jgi:hypothetical protein